MSASSFTFRFAVQFDNRLYEETRPDSVNCIGDGLTSPHQSGDIKRSERLRHKHVSYTDMVQGVYDDGKGSQHSPPVRSANAEASRDDFRNWAKIARSPSASVGMVVGRQLNRQPESTFGVVADLSCRTERAELECLIKKQKHKRLTQKERRKLRRLREKLRQQHSFKSKQLGRMLKGSHDRLLRRVHLAKQLMRWKRSRAQQLAVGSPTSSSGAIVEAHRLEHCYAASYPVDSYEDADDPKVSHSVTTPSISASFERCNTIRSTDVGVNVSSNIVYGTDLVKDEHCGANGTVRLVHRDSSCRAGRRRRAQDGDLHLTEYTGADVPCVRCCTCRESLSIAQFLKHMHRRGEAGRLVSVTVLQKLTLRSATRSRADRLAWEEFQRRRLRYEIETLRSRAADSSEETVERKAVRTLKQTDDEVAIRMHESASSGQRNKVDSAYAATKSLLPSPSITRHSNRVCKRKQLHPIEKYIFSKSSPPDGDGGVAKKSRIDAVLMDDLPATASDRQLPAHKLHVSPRPPPRSGLRQTGKKKPVLQNGGSGDRATHRFTENSFSMSEHRL